MAISMSIKPLKLQSLPHLSTFTSQKPLISFPSNQFLFQNPNSIHFNTSFRKIYTRNLTMKASASDFAEDISDKLGEVTIFTAAGDPVLFKNLWDQNEGIAVVALLRHFGCFCSWDLASVLKEAKSRFDAAGVKLITIGVGTPDRARILADGLPFPMDCLYADPDRKAYGVLGLYYGLRRTLSNPAKAYSMLKSVRQTTKNYTLKATPDNISGVLQQGGMFVFKGKQLLYARKDEGAGDHAPLDEIFDICCKVPVA